MSAPLVIFLPGPSSTHRPEPLRGVVQNYEMTDGMMAQPTARRRKFPDVPMANDAVLHVRWKWFREGTYLL